MNIRLKSKSGLTLTEGFNHGFIELLDPQDHGSLQFSGVSDFQSFPGETPSTNSKKIIITPV